MANSANPAYANPTSVYRTDAFSGERVNPGDAGISCPECGSGKGKVTNSRPSVFDGMRSVRRTRECHMCEHKWATVEVNEEAVDGIRKLAVRDLIDSLRSHYL